MPYVDAGLDTNICDQLIGVNYVGNYVGGYWTGVGMDSSGLFMPFSVGTFDVYYHYTDGNGCYNEDTLGITVDATVYANAGSDFEVCIDSGTISLGGIPVSGVWSGGSMSPQGDYTTSVVDTLDFVFTYGAGNCLTRDTMELIVNPLPVVDAGLDFAVCVDDTIQVLVGNPLGGSWSGTGITNASGDFNPTIAGVGTHTLTYYYLDSNGCDKTDTRDVTVNGLPYVDAGLDTNICDQLIGVNYVGNYVGGYWTGVGMDSSGLFMPFSVGTFDVYYHYTDGNGCYNEDTLGITVDATVYANAGSDFEVCIDSGTISLGGIPVSGVWSGGSMSPQGDYTTSVVDTLDFVFTYGAGNCLTRDTMELIVNPLPVVDAGLDFAVCVYDTIQVLVGNPLGGSWSGTGITNASGDFNPTIAGVGTHTLTYYYLDSNGCDKTDTRDVTVNGLPYVDAGLDTNICDQLIGVNYVGNYVGGYWTGVGMDSSGLFMPFSVGTFDVYYHYTDGNGCYNEDTLGITVDATVYANAGSDFEVCIDSGTISLGGIPVSGVWSGGSMSPQGDYTTSVVDTLDFVFTYGAGNCLTRDTMELIVNPLPVVDAGLDFDICISNPDTLINANFSGGYWYGSPYIDSSGVFSSINAGVGLHQVIYYYKDSSTFCDNTDTLIIDVKPLPVPDFSNDSIVCKNSNVIFNNQSTGANSYLWDFDNANSSTLFSSNNVFSDTGFYNVKLIATSIFGCVDSITNIVDVVDPPSAYVSFQDTGCAPLEVSFVNSSYGKYASYFWDLGNGTNSTDTIPITQYYQQSYYSDTTYFLTFIVNNLCGADTIEDSINVLPTPSSIFLNNISSGCSPLDVSFFNLSVGNPTIYHWNMGDGTAFSATDSLYNHTFSYSGLYDTTYTVSVVAQNYCGSDTSTADISVYPDEVTAFFTTDLTSGCMPLSVNFQNFSVGSNLIYSWDFGDGNFSNSSTVNHTFTTSGLFNVQLIVNDGCSFDTLHQIINVYPIPQGSFLALNDSVCGTDTVHFLNSNTGSSFYWDFGDGNSSTLTQPFNIYTSPGVYNVKLISTSLANGCSIEDSLEVYSLTNPEALFSLDTNIGCLPLTVNFTNSSVNSDYFYWDFGDGSNTSNSNPTYTYNIDGSYTGSLVSSNLNGCQDSISFLVDVNPKPIASFSYNNMDSCVLPISFSFQNTSSLNSNYFWAFGDGDTSTLSNPVNSFANNGQFLVDLYVENIFGCKDTAQEAINIDTVPVANFSMDTISGCIPLLVNFSNNSQNSSFFSWDFGDGNLSSSVSPSFTYSVPGNYQIQLLSQDANGCLDSSFSSIHIFPEPLASFSYSNTNPCFQPVSMDLLNTSVGANYYSWDFGNGMNSLNTSPNFNYDSIGSYSISLIAGNSYGCEDTTYQTFNVYQQPQAIFDPLPDSICLRDSIVLSSINSQYQDLITWNLNGSLFNTTNDTTIFLASAGFYYLEMYASNNNGICIDTVNLSSGIEVLPSPIADFIISPLDGCKPLIGVDFINQSIAADFYNWDFSNGNTSNSFNANENFYNDGIYNISLHVSNSLGCVDSIFKSLEVFPKPIADFTFTNSDPCYQPTDLTFNNSSTGGSIYDWDFGNSQTSNIQNPTVSYVNPGIYNIGLIVENSFGCKDTIENSFEALQVPIADFVLSDDTICVGDSVIFISQSQYTDIINWDLSNGFNSSSFNFTYEFLDTTTVDVTLQAFSNNGCSDTIQIASSVVVINSPVADFYFTDSLDPFYILTGTLHLNNLSQNSTSYIWEFYNGDIFSDFNLQYEYQYSSEGNYPIILSAINACSLDTMMLYHKGIYESGVFVPNSIIPDEIDSDVNQFRPVAVGLRDYRFMIFDTFGNLIWEDSELDYEGKPMNSWYGDLDNDGNILKQDVYIWKIVGTFKNGVKLNKTGTVTLIR